MSETIGNNAIGNNAFSSITFQGEPEKFIQEIKNGWIICCFGECLESGKHYVPPDDSETGTHAATCDEHNNTKCELCLKIATSKHESKFLCNRCVKYI